MFRLTNCAVFLLLIILSACHQNTLPTEKEEAVYWKASFIDSSYRLLYNEHDTTNALRYYDAAMSKIYPRSAYQKATRFDLLANYYYFFTSDNIGTARMIDTALSMYHTPELQRHYARTYVELLLFGGNIAYRLSQYTKANGYYFRAKKLAEAYLDPCERTSFNYSIAMVLYRQQNFVQSLNYFKDAFSLQETCSPQTTAIVVQQQEIQSNIGLCYIRLKKYDSAMVHFDRALQIANSNKDSLGPVVMDKIYGVISGHKAQVAMLRNRLPEAEQLALKSIALNDRKGYEVEHAMDMKLLLAEVYYRKNDFASMGRVLYNLKGTIEKSSSVMKVEWNRLMASYHEKQQQTGLALSFFKRYFGLKDSLAEQQKQLTAADIDHQLSEKEKELQIAVLRKDQQITAIWLWVIVLFSALTVAIIYLVYHHYRRSKKSLATQLRLNEEIKRQKEARERESKQRHRLITEAVIRAQEGERSQIGLELHDNINQVLTTVKLHNEMLLEGVGDPNLILPRTVKYLQDCINEIRSLSKRLSAPTLGKISLEESINDLLDSVNLTSKVKVARHIAGMDGRLFKQELHIGIYRILQEQLNNVLKHAEASEVLVKLEETNGKIRLCVTDNGKGFSPQRGKNGIGLINMQTRAESLNGTFLLNSQPGFGCELEVVFPAVQ